MFLSGAAVVIVRQLLPSAAESRRPEEIGTRFFFGELAGAFANGWIDRDVVVYALSGESYRIRHVRLGGGTYQYCVCWVVDGFRQPAPGSAICVCLVTVSGDTT